VTAGKTGLIDTEAAYDGDRGQIRTSTELRIMAALRNAAIGALRTAGITNIAVVGHASPAPFRTATTGSASGGQSPGGDGSAAATTSGTSAGCGEVNISTGNRKWCRFRHRMRTCSMGPSVDCNADRSTIWAADEQLGSGQTVRSSIATSGSVLGAFLLGMEQEQVWPGCVHLRSVRRIHDGGASRDCRYQRWTGGRLTAAGRGRGSQWSTVRALGCAGKRAKAGGCLSSCLKGEQVRAHVEVSKRGPKGSRTRPFSCMNVVEAQGDLDGRIHPRTAPHVDACHSG
jgi:hypothetical protein